MNESKRKIYDFNFLCTMIFAQMCILEEIEMQDYSKNIQENNSKSKKKQKIEKQKKRQQGNDSQNQNSKNTKKKL